MKQFNETIPETMDGIGREQDRRAVRLDTVWLLWDREEVPRSTDELARDADTAVPVDPAGPTLVILAAAVPAATRSAAAAIQGGGRVYVLAPTDWGTGDAPEWFTTAPSTGVLVRRVSQAPVAAVLSGGRAWLWMGPDGPGRWRLSLTPAQAEAARLAFLDLYWNQADDEAWPEGGRPRWRARGEAPFDLPAVAPDALIRLTSDPAVLPTVERAEVIYSPRGDVMDMDAARMWVPPSGEGHAGLARRAHAGCEVAWSDLGLPLCMTGPRSAMVAATPHRSLHVSLTPYQESLLAELLGQEPESKFYTDVELGLAEERIGADGKVWFAGRSGPEKLIGEQILDVGLIPASELREMPHAEPSIWPQPSEFALTVRWHWRVGTPRAPREATDDPLMKAWRTLDLAYAKRVESVSAALNTIENKEGVLGKAFATLKGPLLGFGRSREGLRTQVQACGAFTPSAGGAGATHEHLALLSDLEERVRNLEEEVAAAEWDAQQKVEHKRQEEEHAQRQEKAFEDLAEQEKELKGKRERLVEVEVEIGELAPEKADMPKRERRARQRRFRDERTKLEKQIETIERLTEELQEIIATPFEFGPATRPALGGRGASSFVPPAGGKSGPRVPEEDLPAVGRLLRADNKRLLAIRTWDELSRGEEEARRLGARLVAAQEEGR